MNRILSCAVTVLIFACAPLPLAAQSLAALAVGENQAIGAEPVDSHSASAEITLLTTQLEDNRRFQDQLLGTVQWSLTALLAVTAVLVGFGWFVNFRMYERDKAALELDLRAQIAEAIRKASNEAAEAAATRFAEQNESLDMTLSRASAHLAETMKKQIVTSAATSAARASRIESDLNVISEKVLSLQLSAQLRERDMWIRNGTHRNALQCSVRALEFATQIGFGIRIGEVLDFVAQDMVNIVENKKAPIDNYLVAQLVAALDAVTESHAYAAAGLKGKVGDLLQA